MCACVCVCICTHIHTTTRAINMKENQALYRDLKKTR